MQLVRQVTMVLTALVFATAPPRVHVTLTLASASVTLATQGQHVPSVIVSTGPTHRDFDPCMLKD